MVYVTYILPDIGLFRPQPTQVKNVTLYVTMDGILKCDDLRHRTGCAGHPTSDPFDQPAPPPPRKL